MTVKGAQTIHHVGCESIKNNDKTLIVVDGNYFIVMISYILVVPAPYNAAVRHTPASSIDNFFFMFYSPYSLYVLFSFYVIQKRDAT